MITRRNAILAGLSLPAWAFGSSEFWNVKKPADWTPEEIAQILTKSPWAKEAAIRYDAGPGSAGRPAGGASTGGHGGRSRRGGVGGGSRTGPSSGSPNV